MKTIHVIPSLEVGGAERCLTKLVTAKRDYASEAIVVSLLPSSHSYFERDLKEAQIRHEVVGIRSALDLPRAITSLTKLIRAEKPDCVQSWLYYGDLIATLGLLLSGRRRQTRLNWGIRCSHLEVEQYRKLLRIAIWACKKLSGIPDAIIANSFAGRAAHIGFGYQPDRFAVVHNGIDTDLFAPLLTENAVISADQQSVKNKPLVGIAGRVDPQKDYATFLRVVDLLPEVNFIAAGKGTTSLPIRDNLRSIGVCEDMPRFLNEIDLFVCTSAFGEGFPNVIAEAMACGTAVVTTDVGDAAHIVGDTGRVCKVGDAGGLSECIKALLNETDIDRQQRGVEARARIAAHFSLDRMIKAFDEIHLKGMRPTADAASQAAA